MDLNPDYHFHGEHEEGNQDDSQSKYEGLELNDKKLPEFWISHPWTILVMTEIEKNYHTHWNSKYSRESDGVCFE